jgi:excisionase family DNA binding protein
MQRRESSSLPDLMTIPEVASALRTTRKSVYALVERGLLPGVVRLGRRLLIDRSVLVEWLEEKRAPSPEGVRR